MCSNSLKIFVILNLIISVIGFKVEYQPPKTTVNVGDRQSFKVILSELPENVVKNFNNGENQFIEFKSDDGSLVEVENDKKSKWIESDQKWSRNFTINGIFLGKSSIHAFLQQLNGTSQKSQESLSVTILRPQRLVDKLFTLTVIILVSVLFINFGAALDIDTVKDIVKRPIGPSICFSCQYIFMPLCSFALGLLLFPNTPELALGLFFTGVSPGGGASNMWTLLLDGNIHLSIIMTTISTIAAFGMMPLWIFTLGKVIFDKANLGVPYVRIALMALGFVVPVIIGVIIQKFLPSVAKVLVKILKPLSAFLILFIIVLAMITNFYIFQLFSWKIIVAGLGLPWIGFSFGFLAAKIFRQTSPDCVAISIETGIQNIGIAVFLLTFSLDQPMADMTCAVPVAVALMTPIPLMIFYLIKKCMNSVMFIDVIE